MATTKVATATNKLPKSEFLAALRGFCGRTMYGKGGFGQRLTMATLNALRDQYPEWYNKPCSYTGYRHLTYYEYLSMFADGTLFIADCCGLPKGIQAGYRPDGTEGKMTPDIDIPIEKMVKELTDRKKDYLKAEEGELIFFSDCSHVMVVSKEGKRDIESAPSLGGVADVDITYQPSYRIGGAGKLPWVDYGESEDDEVKYDELKICRKGSKGDAVRTIQANVGVVVDGDFGKNTESAVKAYQKKKGLTADGIVGQNTWRAIIEGWSK